MGPEEEVVAVVEEKKSPSNSKEEMEAEISRAMRARVKDFREQADSLTLEGVRRALEKDLGVEAFSLDVHKRFIKQCLEEFFNSDENERVSKTEEKNVDEAVQLGTEEPSEQLEDIQLQEEKRDNSLSIDEKKEVSAPSDGKEPSDNEHGKSQVSECRDDLNEEEIKKAMRERASYFRANIKTISLQGVRRLLEEDLKLEKHTLDAHKRFIRREVDEVLSTEVVQASNGVKKKPMKKTSQSMIMDETSKGRKRTSRGSDSSDSDTAIGDEELNEKMKRPKKKLNQKAEASPREVLKKKKSSTEKSKASGSETKQLTNPDIEESSEAEGGNSSEDGHSHSSSQEEVKKKREKPTQVYGKKVEHLKSIIKSCGMVVPPAVYKRAKQAPESKREAYLIKELEGMLQREGLSTNPSEKEIKAVRKKKERAKELEGIDMSNIVTSSRRRTMSSFIPPPKPKEPVESEDDEEDEENDESQEETDDGNDGEGSNEGSDEDVQDGSD